MADPKYGVRNAWVGSDYYTDDGNYVQDRQAQVGDRAVGDQSPGEGWSYAGIHRYFQDDPNSGRHNAETGSWRYDGPRPAPAPPPAPAPVAAPAQAPPPVAEKPKVEFDASQYMARQPTPAAPASFQADIRPRMYESFAGSGSNAFQGDTTARSYDDFVKGLNSKPATADDAEKNRDDGQYVTRFAASEKFRDAIDERLGLRPDDPADGAARSEDERRRARFSMDYR
jgi:hypothetical protein